MAAGVWDRRLAASEDNVVTQNSRPEAGVLSRQDDGSPELP
jgi:hypothetical protein